MMAVKGINGVEINYADIGEGEVVVLLHGLGSTNQDWDLQIPVLAQKFRVIAPDFRAHGNSTRVPAEQSVEKMTEDVFGLMNELGIAKASFVGFSMGGAICFQMALSNPEIVDKMVIINSGPDFNRPNDAGVDLLEVRTNIIKNEGFLSLAESISKGMYPEENQTDWRTDFRNRLIRNDEDAYLKTFGELMKWGIGDDVSKIQNETLVIASDMDYTSVDYKQKYAGLMPNAKLVVIENSRHGVVVDQAEKLNEELLKFL